MVLAMTKATSMVTVITEPVTFTPAQYLFKQTIFNSQGRLSITTNSAG